MFLKLKYKLFILICIKFIIWMYDVFGVVLLNCCKCKNMSYKVLKFIMCFVVIFDWFV